MKFVHQSVHSQAQQTLAVGDLVTERYMHSSVRIGIVTALSQFSCDPYIAYADESTGPQGPYYSICYDKVPS